MNLKLIENEEIIYAKDHLTYQLENNILSFKIEDMSHTIDLETSEFTRENEEYSFYLNILDKKSELLLKKENYLLQVKVTYANILRNQKVIEISYLIETNDNPTKIIIELEDANVIN